MTTPPPADVKQPPRDCALCPRLKAFLDENRQQFPDFHNAPVPSFGPSDAWLLIVGLAPGLKGANRTGRPFTGDYAGDVLYLALVDVGLARGTFAADPNDGLQLVGCRITNAARCVPPKNKPTAEEVATCRRTYLVPEMQAMPNLTTVLALGRVAHDAVVKNSGATMSHYPFAHGRRHVLPDDLVLYDTYHCSRYNVNTGRLRPDDLKTVLQDVVTSL